MTSTRRRTAALACGTLVTGLAAAAPAHGAVQPFGSNLQAPASVADAHPVDTPYWQTKLADGGAVAASADGQVLSVRVKGIAQTVTPMGPGGEALWFLQALSPLGGGAMKIERTSQPFFMPHTGDPQQISTFAPNNFCIKPGESLAFNTVGGFGAAYPNGTPMQIFAAVPGSDVAFFSQADKTNNGDTITATPIAGRELLLQAMIGTGTDAAGHCGGTPAGTQPQPQPQPNPGPKPGATKVQRVTIPARQRITVSRKGKLTLAVFCQPGAARCQGTVKIRSRGKRPKTYGSKRYNLGAKRAGKVTLTLNPIGRKAFRTAKRRLKVRITAVTRPGGASRTATLNTTLRGRR